jgi:hypothetical protein
LYGNDHKFVTSSGGYHRRRLPLPCKVHPKASRKSSGLCWYRLRIMPLALPLGVPGGIAPAFIRASSWLSPAGVLPSPPMVSCLVGAGVARLDSRAAIRLSIASRRASIGSGGNCRYWARAAVTRAVLVVPWAAAVVSSASSKSGARRIVREGILAVVQGQVNGNPAPSTSPRWWPWRWHRHTCGEGRRWPCAKTRTIAPWLMAVAHGGSRAGPARLPVCNGGNIVTGL